MIETGVRETRATDAAAPAPGPRAPRRPGRAGRELGRWAWGLAGILVIALIWEGYKLLGPADGVVLGELRVLPRTTDLAMPHIWDMGARLAEPVTRADGALPLWSVVALAALTTLGIAAAGWLVGVVVGIGLALVMQRWRLAEWGLLPWIVISQTVPLIAFAPVVKSWGSRVEIGSFEWQDWMSVALIASYLAFFPIAIGALKGLQSPDRIHEELMQTYAAGYWTTLVKLRFPASVPYLLPALRLGAANAVIGAVVAEVSTGLQGGIGRILIQFAGQASGDPAKAWAPIFGAIVLGLVAAGSIALLGVILKNYRRTEEAA
ncbi:NitT/TauT family transport system permease protein [Agromyces hippuratus]|uniref:NitT/TauT family transport system permease protein n=1 Tax=Agromyces hippuratus TaxID=286438 RepID=A0A852WV91_9MICO|nr:ABC transporter permease subunit [Agromyces hippuratus]NYG21478.1 NitT/TauT family transport system permease protein [Agromyces hippuratus]